jgi:hypothetical protein
MKSNTGKNIKLKTGKSNLDIVRSYLKGETAFVQVGYDQNTAVLSKKEGEQWTDHNGQKWVKRNGYKQKLSSIAKIKNEKRCSVCNADVRWGTKLDDKIYLKTARCYDCNIEFEAVLKQQGLYQDYEKFKILTNQLGALKDFRQKVSDSITFLKNYDETTKNPQFFNDDGSSEFWIDNTDRREVLLTELAADLEKSDTAIAEQEKELSEIKYDPKNDPEYFSAALERTKQRAARLAEKLA